MKVVESFLFSIFLFSSIVLSEPFIYNYLPLNNTFISGGQTDFNISINELDLNSSSVTLHIIALDAYLQNESWENYTMSCTNTTASNWNCSKKLTFPLVGSDTTELFYFDAKNNSGSTGSNGTANNTHSLRFTLDRKLPIIIFINPTNGTWVSGIENLQINVVDESSGVNHSTVNYSFDNIQWFNTTKTTYYSANWSTANLSNNQTVRIYFRASDNVNNTNQTNINVTVDNELPRIEIISPTQGQVLNSTIQLRANFSDIYSGIKRSSISFSVSGISEGMDCTGSINYTCTKLFDTFRLSDGTHTINFSVVDNAENYNSSSVQVTVSNRISSIRVTEPINNTLTRGTVLFRASLADPTNVNYVKLVTVKEEKSMSCTTDFSGCTVNLDTTQYQDGTYNISIRAMSSSGINIANTSIVITFDNTKPQLIVKYPDSTVNGTFNIDVNVTDEHPSNDKVVFQVDSLSNYMNCNKESEKKLVCNILFDSKLLQNGLKNMTVYATDLAGNLISVSNEIKVSNEGSSTSSTDSSGKNETEKNETTSNSDKGSIFQNIFKNISSNTKWIILISISVLAIVAIVVYKIKKKVEKKPWRPWYETIGE